jgi:hypothetical protein
MKKMIMLMAGILTLGLPAFCIVPQLEKRIADGLAVVNGQVAYELCRTLAAESFSGRLTGSSGYTEASRWAATKFKEWGLLEPDGGYLQAYPSPYTQVDKAEMTLVIAGKERKLEAGKDFLPLLFSDSGRVSGSIVFVGWGISAPDIGYDDYAGTDVGNKFVLCFRGTPDQDDKRFQHYDEHRVRMRTARDKGALGLIYIYPDVQANPNGERLEKFLPAEISEAVADLILEARGIKAAELKKDLQAYRVPITFALDARIDLSVEARHFADGIGFNVVAYLPGSDPLLKGECVVLGAHFDGCGRHLGILFPGADDNASGSAMVMEIARAFALSGIRPKRTLAFVLFGGEEMGLLGSTYYAAHVPAPLKNIDAMFNFDMEGEGARAFTQFSQEPAALKEAMEKADGYDPIIAGSRPLKEVGVRSSDFAPFFLQGIPCAAFYSDGPHLHYHAAGDTIFRINPDIMGAISRLAFLSAWFWADRS